MRVAIVHDWLTGMRGGEKCLEVFCRIFPQADIFTLLHVPGSVSETIEAHDIHTSFIQKIPGARRHYRRCLPLFPRAVESFRLTAYDLVLSSSHCVAKGAVASSPDRHVCYCHTPARYVWDLRSEYFPPSEYRGVKGAAYNFLLDRFKAWDVRSAERVGSFIANSRNVAGRIKAHYGRDSTVIHPPVDTEFFTPGSTDSKAPRERLGIPEPGEYFLMVGAYAPYKRFDLALEAFAGMGKRLVVAGPGTERFISDGREHPSITILGPVDSAALRGLYRGCQALVFPGEEDFGIVPLEANACGRPVIAYAKGGVCETIVPLQTGVSGRRQGVERAPGPTGLFFHDQDPESLAAAVESFDPHDFDPAVCRANAMNFSVAGFETGIREHLSQLVDIET